MNQVREILGRGMCVADLIAELQNYDGDDLVVFACDYGDHSHTQQALPVQQVDSLCGDGSCVRTTAYSKSGLAIEDCNPDAEEESDKVYEGVVILS